MCGVKCISGGVDTVAEHARPLGPETKEWTPCFKRGGWNLYMPMCDNPLAGENLEDQF